MLWESGNFVSIVIVGVLFPIVHLVGLSSSNQGDLPGPHSSFSRGSLYDFTSHLFVPHPLPNDIIFCFSLYLSNFLYLGKGIPELSDQKTLPLSDLSALWVTIVLAVVCKIWPTNSLSLPLCGIWPHSTNGKNAISDPGETICPRPYPGLVVLTRTLSECRSGRAWVLSALTVALMSYFVTKGGKFVREVYCERGAGDHDGFSHYCLLFTFFRVFELFLAKLVILCSPVFHCHGIVSVMIGMDPCPSASCHRTAIATWILLVVSSSCSA